MRANLFSWFPKMFNSSVAPADVLSVESCDEGNKKKPMDVNRYATKKTVAQGMLDIALLTANASQLKYILQTGEKLEFYALLLWLISTSIILQIASVYALIFGSLEAGTQNGNYVNRANEILQYVNDGGEVVDSYEGYDESIFVLGNANSGKSSFASYMANEFEFLNAEKKSVNNTRQYIISDSRNKINTSTLDWALYNVVPRLVQDYRLKMVYYDCPAFGASYSEVSAYFLRQIIDKTKRLKLVLVVSYESLKANNHSAEFSNLMRHATVFLKKVEKFRPAVALIVTKVDNEPVWVAEGRHGGYVDDEEVIEKQISVYLNEQNEKLKMKQSKKRSILVDALLERDCEGKFTRIGLFRKPDRAGTLKNSKALRESRPRLETIIHDNIEFVECDKKDFDFHISDRWKENFGELSRQGRESIRMNVRYIADDIRKHYLLREKISNDMIALKETFHKGIILFAEAINTVSITTFVEQMKKIARTSSVFVLSQYITTIRRYNDFLNFFHEKVNPADESTKHTSSSITNYDWKLSMLLVVEYLKESKLWYEFLIDSFERLSAYSVQRNIEVPSEITINGLRNIFNKSLSSTLPTSIETMRIDKLKLRFLKPLFNVSFYKLIVTVHADVLTVRGSFVKMSEVVKLAAFTNEKTKIVRVFAMNTIFLDVDIDVTGRELKLFILAPNWNFVCDPHITMNGRPGERHDTDVTTGGHGSDGLPGKAGGPAGHFFGIGQLFIAVPPVLRIEVTGGKGGPGQGGSCGMDGRHGEDCHPLQPGKWWKKGWRRKPFLRKSKDQSDKKLLKQSDTYYIHTKTTNTTERMKILGVRIPVKRIRYEYYCASMDGARGGKGGDGGSGGKGGSMGVIKMIDTSNRILFKCSDNAHGCVGVAGSGCVGGRQGEPGISYTAIFEEDRTPFALYYRRPGILNEPEMRANYKPVKSIDGVSGKNSKNAEEPKKYDFGNPIRNIVDYKKLAREYAMYAEINPLDASIKSFINLIEIDPRVNIYDDTRAFIYDLFALENQFYFLQRKIATLSTYESLAHRILQYANKEGKNLPAKDKAILSHVYSTVLSKISTLKRDRNFLVMDFDRYCKSVLTEIKNLNKLNHIDMINEYKLKYEDVMNRKIDEARSFIDETIMPTINVSFKNSENIIRKLLAENAKYISDSIDKQDEVKRVIRQLHSNLVSRRILSVMQLGGQFLQFLGPVGAIVGPAVQGASMIATSLVSPKMEEMNESPTKKIEDLRATLQRNSEWVEVNRQKLREEVVYISRQIGETEQKESVNLTYLKDEIEAHGKKLQDLEMQKDETPFWIMTRVQGEFKMRLNEMLEEKEHELQKRSVKIDKKITPQVRAIKRVKRVLGMSWDIIDLINVSNNIDPAAGPINESLIENELDDISSQLSRLREFEKVISSIFIPLCDKVYSEIQIWEKQLRNKSPAALRMSQWNVQFSLKKIRRTLKEMTDGYRTQSVIMEIIEQIEEGLTMLIDMYDHIQKYHERVELEAYIANVNSYRELGNALEDPEIDRLNVLTRSNVILNLFDNAMDAFKQSVFPFANLYFEDIVNLPNSLRIENNTDSLVREAVSRITNLNEKIRQVSSQLYDLYDNAIMKDVPFTYDRSMTPPFFVWDFKANDYVIQKLLGGFTVTLTSRISKSRIDDNAVKFKNLRIRFILAGNTTMQAVFDKLLENFIFELTHSGEMYFRCGRQFYLVKCNSLKMTFSFKLNEHGEPESTNKIYGRIKDNFYALSPYTTWNVKLVKNKYWNGDFRSLAKFANYPMKVVLEGLGEYVKRDMDHEICNSGLSKYYDTIAL